MPPTSDQLSPRETCLLRVLAQTDRPILVSELFAFVSAEPAFRHATSVQMARDAATLDRLGLVIHLRNRPGRLHAFATPAGRSRARGLDRPPSRRIAVSSGVAVSLATPMLASCVAMAPTRADAPSPPPQSTARTAQVEFDGRLVWSVCDTEHCPTITPKTRAASPVLPVVAKASPAPAPLPPPAPAPQPKPRFESVSVFYPTGRADPPAAETRFVNEAVRLASSAMSDPTSRVFVVGMTDPTGTLAINTALSHQRAERVRKLLLAAGVRGDRVSTQADTSATRPVPVQAIERPTPKSPFAAFRRVDVVVKTTERSGPSRATDSVAPSAPASPPADGGDVVITKSPLLPVGPAAGSTPIAHPTPVGVAR